MYQNSNVPEFLHIGISNTEVSDALEFRHIRISKVSEFPM